MTEKRKMRVAVLGASGYTGGETLRLAVRHENMELVALTAERHAGESIEEVFPNLAGYKLPTLAKIDDVDFGKVDVVFCCLPHGATQGVVKALPETLRIIDLSADFRIRDLEVYAESYGHQHYAPELQRNVAYGLTEHNRGEVQKNRITACPGCYPTSALLPLLPIVSAGQIIVDDIIIDSKSGVTGAGRAAKEAMLFSEVGEGLHAYSVGIHRHGPEIDQELSLAAKESVVASFTPHLVPMNRGILSTIYVHLAEGAVPEDLRETLVQRYEDEPFVKVVEPGKSPATRHVRGSNRCLIGVFADRLPHRAILLCAIDNLVKGSSGQAIQNFNLVFGLPEILGLEQAPIFP
jgi:N-acetyl-gamma-glutamyl-phosphate reductase